MNGRVPITSANIDRGSIELFLSEMQWKICTRDQGIGSARNRWLVVPRLKRMASYEKFLD